MIRLATEKDTKEIWTAHIDSIRVVCGRDYTPEQIAGWSSFQYSHEHWVKSMKNDVVFVFEDEGVVQGFCHGGFVKEKVAEIHGLYISSSGIGKGAGKALLKATIEQLQKEYDLAEIKLSSTKTAANFYLKHGFVASGPEQLDLLRGVEIESTPMVYTF